MPKYLVVVTERITERHKVEVEADNKENAKQAAIGVVMGLRGENRITTETFRGADVVREIR